MNSILWNDGIASSKSEKSFQNSSLKEIAAEAPIRQHFTTAYCPWENVTVERFSRKILRIGKALLSD